MTLYQIYNLVVAKNYPATLVHFLTDRCNARCPFCFIDFDSPHHGKNELTLEEITALVKSMPKSLSNVNFTGGEPFIHRHITTIAKTYFEHTVIDSLFLTSNGYYTEKTIEFCKEVLGDFPDKEIFIALSIDDLPERHNDTRKVKNLFEKCMATFHALRDLKQNVRPSISITVSPENYTHVQEIYTLLTVEYSMDAIQIIMVRDEGVFKLNSELKQPLLQAYRTLSEKVDADYRSGKLKGFDRNSWRGKVLNSKNIIARKMVDNYVSQPVYMHPCRAGALFGVITATGDVYPCEILDKKMGNLREYDFDVVKLWESATALNVRDHIIKTKCNCAYECAMSVNIMSNPKYLPEMASGMIQKK